MTIIGIIANPASGKDIRRLVAAGSVIDNNEKINVVRRAMLGMQAVGIDRVLFMPDTFNIVERAADDSRVHLATERLDMLVEGGAQDSTAAAREMAAAGVGCIITLGGDGTNRAVAIGCGDRPLVPISTGTNNVFPSLVESTLAGLAAALVATGSADSHTGVRRSKRLELLVDGKVTDMALVDIALTSEPFIGTRAIWEPGVLRELVLATAEPGGIGLSSIGAHLAPVDRYEPFGLHIRLAAPGEPSITAKVLAPIAPGLVREVYVRGQHVMQIGETVELERGVGSLALDGEREHVVSAGKKVAVRLTFDGPRVVDVTAVLGAASRLGYFRQLMPIQPTDDDSAIAI